MTAHELVSRKRLRYLRDRLQRVVNKRPKLSYKQYSELAFWRQELENIVSWYEGRLDRFWERLPPEKADKVTAYDQITNAVLTWSQVNWSYYPEHLLLPTGYFAGMRLLDVGCGPIPRARVFQQCQLYALDPLLNLYREAGFPLEHYKDVTFVGAGAEAIPFEDNFFDAVISVNAIDHVDDFTAAAGEIARVLKPNGIVRLEIDYHEPTICEPCALNDEAVLRAFGPMNVRKVAQRRCSELSPEGQDKQILTVWSGKVDP
jgi:ubiquinone/menaquinone biosynthesis C-methylase UbiE